MKNRYDSFGDQISESKQHGFLLAALTAGIHSRALRDKVKPMAGCVPHTELTSEAAARRIWNFYCKHRKPDALQMTTEDAAEDTVDLEGLSLPERERLLVSILLDAEHVQSSFLTVCNGDFVIKTKAVSWLKKINLCVCVCFVSFCFVFVFFVFVLFFCFLFLFLFCFFFLLYFFFVLCFIQKIFLIYFRNLT